MKYTSVDGMVIPVGKDVDAVFTGLQFFRPKTVVLLVPPKHTKELQALQKKLSKYSFTVEVRHITGHLWESIFEQISDIGNFSDGEWVINVGAGSRDIQCAATSAAFVNGMKAFDVMGAETMLLPVLKFSYYKLLTDKKLNILKMLYTEGPFSSLEELGKNLKMSLPLLSYHVNGNLKSDGLRELGLIETKDEGGRMHIELSLLGRMLIKGYVPHGEEE